MNGILIKNPKIKFHAVGAGAEEGSFKFTIVDRDDSCSFRYTEEEAAAKGYNKKDASQIAAQLAVEKLGL